jgi:hypothetical protein
MVGEEYSDVSWEDRIALFLDRRLSEDEESSFLQSAQQDPSLGVKVAREKKFRELLITNIVRPEVSDGLADKIKKEVGVL